MSTSFKDKPLKNEPQNLDKFNASIFDKETPPGIKLKEWWLDLQDKKGDRARLCRAKDTTDIILLPEFHRACFPFKPFFQKEKNWEERLAFILGLLSHVREIDTGKKLAEQMAEKKSSGSQLVSEERFRQLIQKERKDLYIPMIRIIRMLNHKANIYDLANSMYYWGDKVKKRWAFSYFSKIIRD